MPRWCSYNRTIVQIQRNDVIAVAIAHCMMIHCSGSRSSSSIVVQQLQDMTGILMIGVVATGTGCGC